MAIYVFAENVIISYLMLRQFPVCVAQILWKEPVLLPFSSQSTLLVMSLNFFQMFLWIVISMQCMFVDVVMLNFWGIFLCAFVVAEMLTKRQQLCLKWKNMITIMML